MFLYKRHLGPCLLGNIGIAYATSLVSENMLQMLKFISYRKTFVTKRFFSVFNLDIMKNTLKYVLMYTYVFRTERSI